MTLDLIGRAVVFRDWSAARVCCVGVLLACTMAGCTAEEKAVPSPSPSHSAVSGLTSDRALRISAALGSGSVESLNDGVAIPDGASVPAEAVAALQRLGPVTFDIATFTDLGDGAASVKVSAGGKAWTAYLVLDRGQWKVSATGIGP